MSKAGAIGWNELISSDMDAAKSFYKEVVGWNSQEMPSPDGKGVYVLFKSGDSEVAGMMPMDDIPGIPAGTPSHWFTYVQVEDIHAACEAAGQAGGVVMRPPFEIPGMCWIAVLRSSDGSVFGVMQPVPGERPAEE